MEKVTWNKLNFTFLHFKAQLKAEEEARQRKEAEEKEAQQEKRREERRQQKLVTKCLTCFFPFSRDREEDPLPTGTHSAARVMWTEGLHW